MYAQSSVPAETKMYLLPSDVRSKTGVRWKVFGITACSLGASPAQASTFLWGRCLQYYRVQGAGAKWADEEMGAPTQHA